MGMGMAGVKGLSYGFTDHDFRSGAKGDLFPVEDKGVGENFGHTFELVVGGDDKMSAFG
jgi:hypothetical protein|tara:strand:- start:136 stop:312 length:177 start_codon:yes stop_codon:yes gene_type:complete